MRAFVDTSSLFKKYIDENGSQELDALLRKVSEIAVSPVTWVEMNAVLARRVREKSMMPEQAKWVQLEARKDFQSFHRVIWNEVLETAATDLLSHHPLSTLDAVQLASGVLSKADFFVTSDRRLFEAAQKGVRKAVYL